MAGVHTVGITVSDDDGGDGHLRLVAGVYLGLGGGVLPLAGGLLALQAYLQAGKV